MVDIGTVIHHVWSGNPTYSAFSRVVIEDSLILMDNLDEEGDYTGSWAMDISSMGVIDLV